MVTRHAAWALGLLFASTVARADPESDAKDLFGRGRQLRASGDCAGALTLFHKSHELFPAALGSLRNAAECEEAVGRWATARRSWLDLKRAAMLSNDARYAGWDAEADAAAQRLASRVSHLTVDVSTGGHDAVGLEVTVNGEALRPALVGTVLDRDPGQYVVRAHVGAGATAEQKVDLVTGESRVDAARRRAAGGAAPPQPKDSSGSSWTPAGWVTVSVGLAALVGMGVAIGVRQDALGTLSAQCPSYVACSTSLESVVTRGQTASTAATVLAVAGGTLAGAGIIMLVVGASSAHHDRVGLVVSPFGVSVLGSFQ